MPKAVLLRIGQTTVLAETDDSIDLPLNLDLITANRSRANHASDFEEVVDFRTVERSFGEVKDLIVSCCTGLHEAIASIPNPDKVAIEFGIKLIGEAGVPMLTKATGESNFKISIEWHASKLGG